MSTKKAMVERVASAYLKVVTAKEKWFEGSDYMVSYDHGPHWEVAYVVTPTENIGRRGKTVETTWYQFPIVDNTLPVYTFFHQGPPANANGMLRLLNKLVIEMRAAGHRVAVSNNVHKGVDKSLPVPQRIQMPDIEGADIRVIMDSNPIRVYSMSSSREVSESREVISGEIPWKFRAQINALRGQIEGIKGLYALEKFLHANGIPMRVERRMDSQWI